MEKKITCNKFDECKNDAEEYHLCPYSQEINDDFETECKCCPDCTEDCAMDI